MATRASIVTSLKSIRYYDRSAHATAQQFKTMAHRAHRRNINQELKMHPDWDEWDDNPNPKKRFTKWDLY